MKTLIYANLILLITLMVLVTFNRRSIVVEAFLSEPEGVLMPVTNFSEHDSCHYRVKDGCLTASGTIASETTIACPRHWPFGVKVLIEGREYVCEDRYNSNLPDRIDIFRGYGKDSHSKALAWGIKQLEIIVK